MNSRGDYKVNTDVLRNLVTTCLYKSELSFLILLIYTFAEVEA